MINKNALHGMDRRIENALEGIILQIEKKAESAGALKVVDSCWIFSTEWSDTFRSFFVY